MAKHTKAKDPDDGLTPEEQQEVNTWESSVVKDEAPVTPPTPYVVSAESPAVVTEPAYVAPDIPPVPKAPSASKAAEEIKKLQARIKCDQDRIFELEHPYVPFPKMVKGHTFNTQAELDAAGPEFASDHAQHHKPHR